MELKNIRKIGHYIKRILKDPFSKQSRTALLRYMREAFVLVYEKCRKLDFTMVWQGDGNVHNNNYSKSPKKVLIKIFDEIDFTDKHSVVDMGCGKGYVLTIASKYPFENIGGVEYSSELCDICRNNMQVLGLTDVEIYNCDAKIWDGYKKYDIFYFCNPFDETILSVVAQNIYKAHSKAGTKCKIYYLNPHEEARQKAIMEAGFKLLKHEYDKMESYFDYNVYIN